MTISNTIIDRGKIGDVPALSARADEAYTEFISDTRNFLLHAHWAGMSKAGNAAMKDAGVPIEHSQAGVAKAREVIADHSDIATFLRIKRSCQEIYKNRIIESYGKRGEEFLRRLDEADKRGPGSVTYDPNFVYPDYATVDIHIQPGGYTARPLVGMYYDYGTSIFYGGANQDDALHNRLARETPLPKDGKVERVIDIGCSVGQFTCALKKRFPASEVIGIDIGAPMVRYAHLRAVEQNVDVHFAQMPSEALDFPNGHFDLVACHILFHEIPLQVIKKTLTEAYRVLRPGGSFVLWDFATATPENPGYSGLIGMMDAADNGEPYAHSFVSCNVEKLMADAGFTLRELGRKGMLACRVCDKPV
ncbi:MAG: class I SAM-dependent methyltransferase [Rhodobacteraceae bacterium]|nr:class I SAM-dependent methyltransferase [Paracoccaceae bacterium]